MKRVLAVGVAALLMAAFGATVTNAQMKTDPAQPQPKMGQKSDRMGQRVEGRIKSVRGSLVTLEDGTELSIPSTVKVAKDQLKPGTQITAEYEDRAGQKVAKSIEIKG